MPKGIYTRTKKCCDAQRRRFENPNERKKLSDAQKIAQNRPETNVKRVNSLRRFNKEHPEFHREVQNRPEVKAKKSASLKITNARLEVKAGRSAAAKEAMNRTKVKEKQMGKTHHAWVKDRDSFVYPDGFDDKFKEYIRGRYGHICMVCKKKWELLRRRLDIHHINYDKDNLEPDNFLPLCESCHCVTKSEGNRNYWTEVLQNIVEMNKSFWENVLC